VAACWGRTVAGGMEVVARARPSCPDAEAGSQAACLGGREDREGRSWAAGCCGWVGRSGRTSAGWRPWD